MAEERTRTLVGECISRAHVEAARGATLDDIAAACAACDYERAATLALGRARAGEPVPSETVARILPGIELPSITLALIAVVPERARLLELLERREFPRTRDAADLEAIVLFAAWRAGADTARVIPELRRLSARAMSVEGYALLATIAAAIDDPNVRLATKPLAPFAKEYASQVAQDAKAIDAAVGDVIATLPAEIETSAVGGFTVRAAKQVGRNDPCPCGSGLKYKRCCADKQVTPSPIAGVSFEEFLGSQAHRITSEHVEQLALRDLVRVDLTRLTRRALWSVYRRFLTAREWAQVERVLDELTRRADTGCDAHDPDVRPDRDWRFELVLEAFDRGDLALARKHLALLPEEDARDFALDDAVPRGGAQAWDALVAAARHALATGDKLADVNLAYSLLRAEPALGIYFARACIGTLRVDDGETLLDAVEEARDELNLAPEDPAWGVLDELLERDKAAHEAKRDDHGQLQQALAQSTARIDELERKLSAVRTELEQARTRPAAELMRAPEQRDALDERVRELEALIREGNAERRELRKQLEAVARPEPARGDGPRARRVTLEETDDDVGDDVEHGTREVTVPRFERRAIDALGDVPATVAAETMRTIGTLAAGDGFAWRAVKQAKDMVRQVLMARVGIHHRVLFRIEDGALVVLDLITREQLLTTLKRLRSAR
jgi:Trp operon repressor